MTPQLPKERPAPDRTPFYVNGPARIGVLPDVHIPHHDNAALRVAIDRLRREKLTHLLLNGDAMDCEGVAAWDKDPTKKDLLDEIEATKLFLAYIRFVFPKVVILYKHGNHEDRLERYLWRKAPELAGLPTLQLRQILQFERFGISEVPTHTKVKLGKLVVIHGHEHRFAISNPVNPARGIYLRMGVGTLVSHFHQFSTHSQRNGDDKLITTWSTGCLCQLSPDYAPLNNWSHGFATVEVAKDGAYDVSNYRILHGKCWTS